MVSRQAILDFRTTGDSQATSNVIRLADALERQRQNSARLAPVSQQYQRDTSAMGAVSQSATAKITSLTNSIGPLGAGLGHISRVAPAAALGLINYASGAERASLASRMLNTTVIAGASAMLAGGVALAAMADDAIRAGDTYASLHARIRTYSEGAIQTAGIERELYANAKDARTAIEGQVALYARLSPAVQDYGKSQQDALAVTKLVSQAQAIQGADIREQLASTIQFSQSIASGVLRGDELRSMLESSPQLLRYIAENLDVGNGKIGVAFSQLRNLGKEGQLTTERVLDALLRAGPQIEKDFINAPKTAQQGWQVLTDQITRAVGQLGAASGMQQGLVDWLLRMSDAADAFREKMLLDPKALDPIKEAGKFMGEAVGSIATLGGVAAEHFNDIVMAGQAIIALKLGMVFASWFTAAAQGAKTALGTLQGFRAAAMVSAAATLNPTASAAASGLRLSADALDVRATELKAQAEQKLAQATAARTAAYAAANQANVLKIQLGAQDVRVTEAQVLATRLNTAAVRAEEQAKKAAAAASAAHSAATVRAAAAQQAEAIATTGVTRATLISNAAKRVALGLYNALGGAVGIAGLALGALIFAIYRGNEAWKAQIAAQREALVVSEALERINGQLTSATWAQVPALMAEAEALRVSAAAAREKAEATLEVAKARRDQINAELARPGDPDATMGLLAAGGRADRNVAAYEGNLAAARRDEFAADMAQRRATLIQLAKEAGNIRATLSSGKDAAGRPLTADAKAALENRRDVLFKTGQGQVDTYQIARRQQEAAMAAEKDPAKKAALRKGLRLYGDAFDTASELVSTAQKPDAISRPAPGDGKTVRVPAAVNQALTELIEQQYLPKAGGKRFGLKGGLIQDGGSVFTARSEDEAAAAAKYVKQIDAINAATDAQIGKTGKSRDALRQAASAMLDHAVATSKASQADEKWADIQAEMDGTTRAVVKAQREVNDLMEDGARITDAAAKAYVDYVAAREKAKRMQQALQVAEPAAREAFNQATGGLVTPTDQRGVVDIEAATRQLMARKQAIIVESARRIGVELQKQREVEGLTEAQYQQRLSDALAANRIAVETELQTQLLTLERDRLQQSAEYAERRYGETADAIINALDASRSGDFSQAGADLMNSLLDAAYNELIFNPLRQAIIDTLRSTFSGGGSSAGGVSGFLMNMAGAFLGGGGASFDGKSALAQFSTAGNFVPTNVPGHAGGGWMKGPGTSTSDSILIRASDKEFMVRAAAAKKWGPWLEAINGGYKPPAFAAGGSIGGHSYGGFGAGKVEIHNHMSDQGEAQVTPTREGLKIDFVPLAKPMVAGVLASRDGARAIKQAPFGPKKRG